MKHTVSAQNSKFVLIVIPNYSLGVMSFEYYKYRSAQEKRKNENIYFIKYSELI